MKRKIKKITYGLAFSILLLTACGKKENVELEKVKKVVEISKVERNTISDIYLSDGTLEPREKIEHTLDTQGTVVSILKKNGDFVKKDEVVVTFKDSDAKASYQTAKANYEAAKSNFESSKNNFKKFKTLYDQQMISQIEYLNYKDQYSNAEGEYNSKKAIYEKEKTNFEKLERRADIDGYIGNLNLKSGNIVNSSTSLFTIVNEKKMEVTVDFPGYWLNKLKVGSEVNVYVADLKDKEFKGKIEEINPIANSDTKKFPVKIVIENRDKELKSGMYSKVKISTEKREGILVPQEAVFIRDLLSYVYKIENGKARRVEVVTGATSKPNIEIIRGDLQPEDEVVSEGIFGLSDGDEVEIINKK